MHFWSAAKAYNTLSFKLEMEEIKKISVPAYNYLMEIDPATWTRHAFDHQCKVDHVTNNMTESFNSWLGELRCRPVLSMLELMRQKLMRRLVKRRTEGEKWDGVITKYVTERLNKTVASSRNCHPSSGGMLSM